MQNLLYWDVILYTGVFGVADYRSMLKIRKFKRADPIWRTKMQKVDWLGWNLVLRKFWGRCLRIRVWNSEIKNGVSKKADQNAKLLDLDGIWYSEVCALLITNPSLKFRNSKWQKWEMTWVGWNSVLGELKVQKLKMADPIWCQKIQKVARFRKKSVLKIPDSKSELKSDIKIK